MAPVAALLAAAVAVAAMTAAAAVATAGRLATARGCGGAGRSSGGAGRSGTGRGAAAHVATAAIAAAAVVMATRPAAAVVAATRVVAGIVAAANVVAATSAAVPAAHAAEQLERIRLRTQTQHTGRAHGGHQTALHRRLLKIQNTGRRKRKQHGHTCRRNRWPRVALGRLRQPSQGCSATISVPLLPGAMLKLGSAIVAAVCPALLSGRVTRLFASLPGRLGGRCGACRSCLVGRGRYGGATDAESPSDRARVRDRAE